MILIEHVALGVGVFMGAREVLRDTKLANWWRAGNVPWYKARAGAYLGPPDPKPMQPQQMIDPRPRGVKPPPSPAPPPKVQDSGVTLLH